MSIFRSGARAMLVAVAAVPSAAFGVIQLFEEAGGTPADIVDTVDSFRAALGALNANAAGSFVGGRREINWDGVPDAFAVPNVLPRNFFNVVPGSPPPPFGSPRGVVFSTPGSGFAVSADSENPTGTAVEFANINELYGTYFATFSAQRLFTALGSNITDVRFFVPGSDVPARVRGFGAVFTDVDVTGSTTIDYFNAGDELILSQIIPAYFGPSLSNGHGGQSFAGVTITEPEDQIARVRIQSGFLTLSPEHVENPLAVGADDLVVMDDFIFAEPVGIPEPGCLGVVAAGWLLARRRAVRE